ncbi:MAG: gliding motility-associated C-terminal domain-containing protein, partial [Bacteroidia bacterium]|nr:gliding motility-associated C-terminal domain-containing protein [Bacteroidia bacterium]
DFWSRIDTARMSDTQYVPRPVGDPSNPGPLLINTIRGYQFKALDPIAQNMYIFNTIGPDIGVTAADPVLNVFTSPGHGLANGDLIRFTNAGSVNGLNLSYNYIVNAASSNTFKILVGAPGSFPNISLGSPPFNPAAFKRVNQAPFDSITDYYKWFKKDISKLNYQKFRSNLRGYGINIMGPMVQVEDPNAKPPVVINPFLKSQCGPDFPVEFTNATNVYQSNNLYIKWDFADDYAPKCTSFSVGGPKPYINGTDLLAKTTGRYITGGVVYPGRVNCKYSHDTLPIHSYVNWNQIFIWFKYGHDFPPFDTSANGWTKDISKVTWPNGPGTYPSGRKLVHPSDSATWNIPIYSAGPTTSRLDTFTRIWPADKLPNSTITLANPIPDPFAIGKGYNRATIGQGTIIDSGSFVTPLLSPLPDKSTRRYRGSYLLPGNSSKTLYQYAFKRGVTDKYTVSLTMRDSFNNQSDDPYKTYTRINMIAGKITIVQKTDTTPGFPVIHTSSEYSANSIPPSIVNDTLIYNYKAYKVYTDPSTSQKYVLIKDDEFFVDYFDCGSTATVELPLVEADAYGLGYEGRICPGLNRETGANPTLHFDPINGAPGLYPPSKDRTYLLVNFDSILDRHDLTPCALDGFVDWNAISPMTGTNVTLGGKTFPPFNKGVDFGGPTKWLNATDASIDVVHYQPQGNWAFDTRPYASNGYVTIGIIIGNGHAFPGSSLPGCISDTVWYHNFWHFVVLNASFTYRKVGGYSTYNSATITGSPSVLPSQDYTYDTTKTSGTYFEPWSRLFGKGDILEFETQIKRQDFIMADYWDWRDGYITIDSFYTNVGDTFVHLKPSNPNDSTFFLKNTFPIDRIRHEYNTDVPPGDLIQVRSYRPYPIGINVFDTIIAETIWQCNDLTHQLPPQSITQNPIRIDSGFFVHPIRHQFRKSSWETEYPGGLGRIGNIEGQPIEHSIYTYDTCYFKTTRYIIIGVIDTFTIKGNDNILCVGESGEFTDSIIYWTPNSNGAVNPSRPLPPGVTETVDVFMHRLDMRNYPVDTIKTFANPTKKGKIDTAFYARIYWDFESDGLIDHAGSNPTHKFNLPGRFKVSMITRDTVGYWDTCFMFVDVVEPHAHFTSKKIFTCSDPTNFNDSSYVKDDCYLRTGTSCDQVKNIKWWFGDIGYGPNDWRSTVKNPLYPYRKNGWYRLQETILTDQGCVDTFRKDIYIAGPRPRIKLLGDTIGCAPYKLRILSYPNDSGGISSTGATYFEFGRPDFRYNIAAYNNPDTVTVVYDEEGVYTIRATGYDKFPGNLCKGIMLPDTVDGFENAIKIYVKNPYRVKVAVTKKEVCVGEIFKVLNLSNRDTITKFRLYTYNSDTAIIDTLYKTNFPADTFFQYVFNQAGVYSLVLHSTRFKLGSPECESKDTVKVIARRAKADLKIDSLGLPKFFITNLSDSINGSGYIWRIYNPDGGLRTELVVPNNASQYFNYGLLDLKNDIGEFKVCIVATTSLLQNCNDSVCKTVINNFQTEINIPNVFTPDGNGVNDEFEIKIKGEELYDLKIWNRWGGEVFESTDSKKMWNGHTQNNGAENPDGTYYFIFKYRLRTNQEQIVRGTITLIRN